MNQLNSTEMLHDMFNPIDTIEEFLTAQDWIFSRVSEDEINLQVSGQFCDYELLFQWRSDHNAMEFTCAYNLTIAAPNDERIVRTLARINSDLWMGHFEIEPASKAPRFRYTSLCRNNLDGVGMNEISEMMETALHYCERFYAAFDMLSHNSTCASDNLELAMMDTAGCS